MPQKPKSEKELVSSAAAAAAPRRKSAAPRTKAAASPRKKHTPTQAETPSTSSVGLPAAAAAAVAAVSEPTYDEIATLAYAYWEARGCQGGSPDEDWLRAEQELRVHVLAAAV